MSIENLKKISLFESLEEKDLQKIAEITKERIAPKGTILFREGEAGDAFYMIVEGGVEIVKREGDKDKLIANIEGTDKNEFFGETALIANAPRNATVRTTKDSKLLVIEKSNFDMMLRLNSFIALSIMQALTKRLPAGTAATTAKAGKVLAVFSPKSGAGKSIFAANMAAGLAKATTGKVLLIDLDLQFGDLAFMFNMKVKQTIADLVENPTENIDALKGYFMDHKLGFSVLAAPRKPEQSEMITSAHLRSLIDAVRRHFDYIILDTHSMFQDLTIHAMDLADLVFLMMVPSMNHLKSMVQCLGVISNLKYPSEKIKLVLNRDGAQMGHSREDIETACKRPVDFTIRDDFSHANQLVEHQKTVFELDGDCSYHEDMSKLIEALTGKKAHAGNKTFMGKLKGLFGS